MAGGGGSITSPVWPRGWAYLSLPLLAWQRLDSSTVLVEWRDGDPAAEAFDAEAEYSLDASTSTTYERVAHLLRVVLMDESFAGGITVIFDATQMSYAFASRHLSAWVWEARQFPGWQRVRCCHLVVTGFVTPIIVRLAVAHDSRLRAHADLEAACLACGVDPEVVV